MGAFEAAKSVGYGNFPNALLPAVRRGWRIFGRFLTARKRGDTEFGPELALAAGRLSEATLEFELKSSSGGVRRSLVWACGAFSAPCCLTIASEERETWAAGSLRDFGSPGRVFRREPQSRIRRF